MQNGGVHRSDSTGQANNAGTDLSRKSSSVTSLPSPPPSFPLPPLPVVTSSSVAPASQPTSPTHGRRPSSKDQLVLAQLQEDHEARISAMEKKLKAEKALNTVLEESFIEIEQNSTKVKAEREEWRRRAEELEVEIKALRDQQSQPEESSRLSLLAEEERRKREIAEAARRRAEERMQALSQKKRKKASLNCF